MLAILSRRPPLPRARSPLRAALDCRGIALATLLYRERVDLESGRSALGPNAVTRKHRPERKAVIGDVTECGAKACWVC
jgi:hypothetical protein